MTSQDILEFWFEGEPLGELQMTRWWKKNEATDQHIRDRFKSLVEEVHGGLSDQWSETAEGRLAAIICLDQFPRNMYRNDRRSFAYDSHALKLSREGLTNGQEKTLGPLQQTFFAMPLMHSEQLEDQDECVRQFERLVAEATGTLEGYLSNAHQFAIKHRDIVARFQRFPHRNAILERDSSDEEVHFLSQPGSSF